ncbi:hypothetical protein B188_03640 [Candidatus Brocadiaceae bacterium B188]|nr:hypothetical protein [Candidatus Brocadia sapporoensis]QQR67580.1 MAG: hypothetical protein IPI25_05085 [Candidatus Brocadia sp.]RZV58984.1 MAG: hypothetical protein EX330_03630 [Candidatus Brocadia sp. BROELEC01]TWU52410.1 hypothetical protein B188_03640 [Candidatus Brocadiaceae bacterium B188]
MPFFKQHAEFSLGSEALLLSYGTAKRGAIRRYGLSFPENPATPPDEFIRHYQLTIVTLYPELITEQQEKKFE